MTGQWQNSGLRLCGETRCSGHSGNTRRLAFSFCFTLCSTESIGSFAYRSPSVLRFTQCWISQLYSFRLLSRPKSSLSSVPLVVLLGRGPSRVERVGNACRPVATVYNPGRFRLHRAPFYPTSIPANSSVLPCCPSSSVFILSFLGPSLALPRHGR